MKTETLYVTKIANLYGCAALQTNSLSALYFIYLCNFKSKKENEDLNLILSQFTFKCYSAEDI